MNPTSILNDPTFRLFIYTIVVFVILASIQLFRAWKLEKFRKQIKPGQLCRVRNYDDRLTTGLVTKMQKNGFVLVQELAGDIIHMVKPKNIYLP